MDWKQWVFCYGYCDNATNGFFAIFVTDFVTMEPMGLAKDILRLYKLLRIKMGIT